MTLIVYHYDDFIYVTTPERELQCLTEICYTHGEGVEDFTQVELHGDGVVIFDGTHAGLEPYSVAELKATEDFHMSEESLIEIRSKCMAKAA